ncbi:MAG: S24/S26 family peptidase [Methanoregula sp.]|nr:S24/S26 family peptidase [Methanoregula sp.]
MSNDRSPVSSEENITPYFHAGGSLSLSGPALAGLTREILDRGLLFRFTAPGTSMSPFIRDRDVITLAPFQSASCRPGDVVAFVRPGTERLVVHRVIQMTGDGCFIKGDNTPENDGEIPCSCILGKVVRVERTGKTVRFGLGPERNIIVQLSRRGWLPFFMSFAKRVGSAVRRLK